MVVDSLKSIRGVTCIRVITVKFYCLMELSLYLLNANYYKDTFLDYKKSIFRLCIEGSD